MTWSYRRPTPLFGARTRLHAIALGAGLALSVAASNGPPAPAPPIGKPSLVVYRAPAAAASAPFVGVIGDSTGSQLAAPLAAQLTPHGVNVVLASVGGCQPTDVVMTFQSPEYYERHKSCPQDAQLRQNTMTAQFSPKVVVWSDVMEWSDIKANDQTVPAGSDRWLQLIQDGLDRTLQRLGTANVVLILPTWWAGFPAGSPAQFPVDRQRALFRTWAARHPGRVTVVDLGPVICPAGPPCQQVVNGVQLRTDHVHYSPEGIRRVITKVMADAAVLRNLGGPAAPAKDTAK